MSATAGVRALAKLLRSLEARYEPAPPPVVTPDTPDAFDALMHQLVYSLLQWEASTGQAKAAMRRLRDAVVDYNELRVCVPDEVTEILGEKYPFAHERALRMRGVLNDVFRRQHAMSLEHLRALPKREARAWLDGIDGMPAYVAARLVLVELGGHALPCDGRLRALLVVKGVLEEDATAESGCSWLERHVAAENALKTHLLLQTWADEEGATARPTKKAATKAGKRPGRITSGS